MFIKSFKDVRVGQACGAINITAKQFELSSHESHDYHHMSSKSCQFTALYKNGE